MTFAVMPVFMKGLFGTGGLVLCLVGAENFVLSLKQKKWRFLIGAMFLMLSGSTISQMVRFSLDDNVRGRLWPALEALPIFIWFLGMVSLLVMAVFLSYHNLQWNRTHVTPLSIQEGFEKLTEGLCFYRKGGQCILVNGIMHGICKEMSGHMLLNGEEFEKNLFDDGLQENEVPLANPIFTMKDGRVFSFAKYEVAYERESLQEIIASDITELYGKTIRLKQENERLLQFQEELKEYQAKLMDSVRKEEILRAKMSIHDEMNRLLLSTKNAICMDDETQKQNALNAWMSNAILLCKESENNLTEASESMMRDLQVIAKSMGIRLCVQGRFETDDPKILEIITMITREAMSNAIKHAQAKELSITIERGEEDLRILYVNQLGNEASTKSFSRDDEFERGIRETGGLKNIRQKVERISGRMEVVRDKDFCLRIRIPLSADDKHKISKEGMKDRWHIEC